MPARHGDESVYRLEIVYEMLCELGAYYLIRNKFDAVERA